MSANEDDLRKDLEAAFEQHSEESEHKEAGGPSADSQEPVRDSQAPETTEIQPTADASKDGGEGQPSARKRDEKGKFVPGDGKTADGKPTAKSEGAPKTDTQPAAAKEEQPSAPEPIAAPAGWKAGAREHWAKIPRAAQEEIVRREKETAQTLRQSSQARQLASDFQNVVNPFLPLIQSQGSNPMQAVRNLMTTAAGLTVGTQEQKARIVSEIIQNYGIDIATLDSVLAGSPVQHGAPNHQQNNLAPPPWAAPIFQFMNTVQQGRQQREHQIVADAEAETAAFAEKNEFFEDVREEMADLMEMAARRGVIMTIQQAYDKAVSLNPEISSVVQQRSAARRSQQTQQNIQKNRNAASSISGAPKGGPAGNGGAGDDSRRSALSEAWDAQMGR